MKASDMVGARVAERRKLRGLTGRELADRAHVSYSLLSKVESGHVPPSPAFTAAVARALGVSMGKLNGQPYRDEPPTADHVHASIPDIRREAAVYRLPPADGDQVAVRDLDDLFVDVAAVSRLRQASAYHQLAKRLTPLLADLRAAIHLVNDHHRPRVAALLAEAYDAARQLAYKLGYADLAALLIDRYDWAASLSSDPLAVCVGDTMRAAELIAVGDYTAAAAAMARSRAQIEPFDINRADPATASVWGYLHLEEALATARAGDADQTWQHHAEAARVADILNVDRDDYRLAFGPTNVGIWSVGLAVELCDHAKAVANAEDVYIASATPRERASHHYIDLARGWVHHGDRLKALESLQTGRRIAPQHIRYHPMVRETVHAIAQKERRANDTLRSFATWVGIED